jgi:hypothetical protein
MASWTTADGHATHRLTFEQRAELRLRIDAARRELLHRQKRHYRECPGCREFVHRGDFPYRHKRPGWLCVRCVAVAEGEGGGAA